MHRSTASKLRSGLDPAHLALLGILILLVTLSLRQVGSLDVGFHLSIGEWMLEHHAWPEEDPLTFTRPEARYLDPHWAFQLLLTGAHRIGGAAGIVMLRTLLLGATFLILLRTLRLTGGRSPAVPGVLLLSILASELRFMARPELVTYLLLAITGHLLHRRSRGRRAFLWFLPLIQLVWVNSHGLFVLGLLVTFCFWLGSLWRRRPDHALLGWGLAGLAVSLANPYGARGLLFPLSLLSRYRPGNHFARVIGEFQPPLSLGLEPGSSSSPVVVLLALYALLLLTLLALIPNLRRGRYEEVLLTFLLVPLALGMVRNAPLAALGLAPVITGGLRPRRPDAPPGRWGSTLAATGLLATGAIALLLAVRVASDAYYIGARRPDRSGLGWNRLVLPVDAARYVRSAGLSGRMLNHLDFGGYLGWALRQRVFIDGRLELMGEERYREAREILTHPETLRAGAERWDLRWIILRTAGFPDPIRLLELQPDWEPIYRDALATIYLRSDDPARPVARRLPSPPELRREGAPGLGSGSRISRWRHWWAGFVRRERYPTRSLNLGVQSLFLGHLEDARAWFEQAARECDGAYPEPYDYLGAVALLQDRPRDAIRAYRIVLQDRPRDAIARRHLENLTGEPARP